VANGSHPGGNTGSTTLITVLVVVAILYFARTILIPLSLAVLVAFLLGPLVIRLRHYGFGRVTSTLSVVLLSFALLGSIGTVRVSQMTDLAHKLPEYQKNVHRKMESFRSSGTGFVTQITRVVSNLTDSLTPRPPTTPNQHGAQSDLSWRRP
jgi:predicted PurR-regulated permease PerM